MLPGRKHTSEREIEPARAEGALPKRTHGAAHLGLTAERRGKAIRAFRETGIYARAAEAAGVDDSTLRTWRSNDPAFAEEMRAAGRALDAEVGQMARSALKAELGAYLDGVPVKDQVVVQRTGQIVEVERTRELNVAAVRTGLTKLDRAWTHPAQQVEHSGSVTLLALVREEQPPLDGVAERVPEEPTPPALPRAP